MNTSDILLKPAIDSACTGEIAAQRRSLATSKFALVYRQQRQFLTHVLRASGLPSRDIDDALQDVFLTLFRREPEFDDERALRAWLREVARFVSCNCMRTRRRREPHWLYAEAHAELELVPADARSSPEHRAVVNERFRRTCGRISALTAPQRELIVLRYFEELRADEIAVLVGSAAGTIISRLRVARQKLEKSERPYPPVSNRDRFHTTRINRRP